MTDRKDSEGQKRRRSRTVSWDHSVRSDGAYGTRNVHLARGENITQFEALPQNQLVRTVLLRERLTFLPRSFFNGKENSRFLNY